MSKRHKKASKANGQPFWAKTLFQSMIAIFLWLAVLEVFLRWLPTPIREEYLNQKFNTEHKAENPVFGIHPTLGKWNLPNHEGIVKRREYQMHVRINNKSLRGPEVPYDRKTLQYRILFLGDSFTYGTGVEWEETFVARIEEKGTPLIEAINGGAPGASTFDQFQFLKLEGYQYSPDLIILCFFQNDIEDNYFETLNRRNPEENKGLASFIFKAVNKASALLDQYFYGKSALYAFVVYFKRNHIIPYTITDEQFQVTQKALDQIKEQADFMKTRLAMVYIPRREELKRSSSPNHTTAYLARYTQQRDIPLLDLSKTFRKHPQLNDIYFPLDTHLTAYGHEITAEAIYQFLIPDLQK